MEARHEHLLEQVLNLRDGVDITLFFEFSSCLQYVCRSMDGCVWYKVKGGEARSKQSLF